MKSYALMSNMVLGMIMVANIALAQTTTPVNNGTTLSRNLYLGLQGSDVLQLQHYFVQQGLLAADMTTGYFGAHTQRAVQTWQAAHEIVSSGNPSTTGFGFVGPKTRALLASNALSQTNQSRKDENSSPPDRSIKTRTAIPEDSVYCTGSHCPPIQTNKTLANCATRSGLVPNGTKGAPDCINASNMVCPVSANTSIYQCINGSWYCFNGSNNGSSFPTPCSSYELGAWQWSADAGFHKI